jgi:hypothetical protein
VNNKLGSGKVQIRLDSFAFKMSKFKFGSVSRSFCEPVTKVFSREEPLPSSGNTIQRLWVQTRDIGQDGMLAKKW